MADKKNPIREILVGKPKKPPTTGGQIKESVAKIAKSAQLKGIGVGGTFAEFKSPGKGVPAPTAKWKVGIVKGAGVKPNMQTGEEGRGRRAKAGFQIKVRW
jgi:hypothetical protein